MKSDSNTEMDLLLRRHARRGGLASPGAGDSAVNSGQNMGGAHMDADEMNAYAEGELPAAARARYVEHIADCDQCRTIITTLTLAANVSIKEDPQQAATPKASWREWLAALLSPPVIRYGVPAIVAICVVGIAFLAMRQRDVERQNNEPTFVARNDQRDGQTASSAVGPGESQTSATSASPATSEGAPATGVDTTTVAPKEGITSPPSAPADREATAGTKQPGGPTTTGTTAADAPVILNERPKQEEAERDLRDEDLSTANRPAPAAAAPPPPATTSRPSAMASRAQEQAETDKLDRNRKDGSSSEDRQASVGMASNTASRRETQEKRAELAKSAPASQSRRRAASRAGTTTTDGADSNMGGAFGGRATEERSVAGRKFRRQGGVWIDTAYGSGRATVNVARGSEQYRALIADEPGLRAIADQLGGEVVVIWKGRAYRIR